MLAVLFGSNVKEKNAQEANIMPKRELAQSVKAYETGQNC